ncbi:sulfotransferase 1C4 [Aspergillus udagawae]|uniref:Sulfotransferase 1C4 n=1 Tax=Aspergillus udagawae TaxID=91492 RepID=A0ABQ1ASM6_9EURO|nr:sulfotransferase 1C4 [Aspergillus udagawae]GFF87358.1 sulfotransferase 1C4 [Aspergillus udagawae]
MRLTVFGPDSVHKQVVVLTVSVLFGSGGGCFDIRPYHPSLWRNDPKVPKFGFDHVPFAEVNEITDAVSFPKMKADKFSSLVNQQGHSGLFRKGKVGSWREQFTAKQTEVTDSMYQDCMADTGLSFGVD